MGPCNLVVVFRATWFSVHAKLDRHSYTVFGSRNITLMLKVEGGVCFYGEKREACVSCCLKHIATEIWKHVRGTFRKLLNWKEVWSYILKKYFCVPNLIVMESLIIAEKLMSWAFWNTTKVIWNLFFVCLFLYVSNVTPEHTTLDFMPHVKYMITKTLQKIPWATHPEPAFRGHFFWKSC